MSRNMIQHCFVFFLLLVAVVMSSCKTDFEEVRYNKGDADFTTVVAIGGAHLAGYSDRALYLEAQSNSIPAILAKRFAFAGGGTFRQPLVNAGVGIGGSGNARYTLQWVQNGCGGPAYVAPAPLAATGDVSNFNWLGNTFTFNNLAVPNTRIFNITEQTYSLPSQGNPFFARFASSQGFATITGDAVQQNPTFTIIWLGMEDVYNFARTGGREGGDSITSNANYALRLDDLTGNLSSLGSQGIIINLPNPDAFPFFTHRAYNDLELTDTEAQQLNNLYASVDTSIHFSAGKNAWIIVDTSSSSGLRQIMNGEMLLLSVPTDSIQCLGWGTTIPIPGRYVLDASEMQQIKNAVISYNSAIIVAAATHGFAIADLQSWFESNRNGILINGYHYSTAYLNGGIFSTDGYHFSQRGAALVANELINTINIYFKAKLPKADVNSYPDIAFP